MFTTPTQEEIVNLALTHISQKPITDIDDTDSIQAVVAKRVWEMCLKEALRNHDWPFATVTKALTLVTDYEHIEFEYAYAYPECLALWHVINEGTVNKDDGEIFKVIYDDVGEQVLVVTNCEDAYGEYTVFIDDTTKFDSFFVTALSHRLAAELAMALNGDAELSKAQIAIFNTMINEAERMSSYESKSDNKTGKTSSILKSRA